VRQAFSDGKAVAKTVESEVSTRSRALPFRPAGAVRSENDPLPRLFRSKAKKAGGAGARAVTRRSLRSGERRGSPRRDRAAQRRRRHRRTSVSATGRCPRQLDAKKVDRAIDRTRKSTLSSYKRRPLTSPPDARPRTTAGCHPGDRGRPRRDEGAHAVVSARRTSSCQAVRRCCMQRNATVTICSLAHADLGAVTRQADIHGAAVGRPIIVPAR